MDKIDIFQRLGIYINILKLGLGMCLKCEMKPKEYARHRACFAILKEKRIFTRYGCFERNIKCKKSTSKVISKYVLLSGMLFVRPDDRLVVKSKFVVKYQ